ncbi:MAG: bifunctional precorrin-2 dehydrogenase/sirohydrochlorin ferrochelatase [Nitrospirae bacterium]|nr:bifunctional precorrin-2 dehydrogenase/sirohydrochlorin ferrochelatase [Nitrospirota bacterium]
MRRGSSRPSRPINRKSRTFYPVNLDLEGRAVLVIGGGKVAERKIESLIACGANVRLVSPESTARIRAWAAKGTIRWAPRSYKPGHDERGAFLVIAATDDARVNRAASRAAKAARTFINVVDVPELCTCTIPAVVRRGDLQIAVSTGGASPAFSRRVREELEKTFGQGYERHLDLLGRLRAPLREMVKDPASRQDLMTRLASLPIPRLVSRGENSKAVEKVLGTLAYSLSPADTENLAARVVRPVLHPSD